jgi:hypothetical protein
MTAERVATTFVAAINSRQVEALSELMTENHVFVDSDGSKLKGRERVCQAWAGFFAMVPDYRIIIGETLGRDDTVVILGRAEGNFGRNGTTEAEKRWSVPAAWRVVVEGTCVAVWQVYVNPEAMTRMLERLGSP